MSRPTDAAAKPYATRTQSAPILGMITAIVRGRPIVYGDPWRRSSDPRAGWRPRCRVRAARRAARAGYRGGPGVRVGGAPARRGRHRNGQEPRVPDPGARLGQARRRRDRDEGATAAAARQGRPRSVRRARSSGDCVASQGRENYLCRRLPRRPRAARRLGRRALPDRGRRSAVRRAAGLDRNDGERRSGRAAVRAESVALGRARRRRRPVSRPQRCPVAPTCFSEAVRERAADGGARGHEPRALPG